MKKTVLLSFLAAVAGLGQVEPEAANWKTWVISSGREFRLAPPPDRSDTRHELQDLKLMIAQAPADAAAQVAYWDAGAPGYRWLQLLLNRLSAQGLGNPKNTRALALMNVAIYDATVAAWDTKYEYNRPRPAAHDRTLKTLLLTPSSPSYPSEHAVTAAAAASVLGYLFPTDAQTYADLAKRAGQSRLYAGVQYPSDVDAGLQLGRDVAAKVIERAKTDGSDAVSTGAPPVGPGFWTGSNPVEPMHGSWRTWALSSGNQFRPGPPPAYDSAQKQTELAEIKNFSHAFASDEKSMFWQSFDGIFSYWYDLASREIFENHLDGDPPRAARVYALASITHHDASVTCWDAKYTYWAARPFQLDKSIVPLFTTPNHPSYPAAHGCYSGAIARTLATLFPADGTFIDGRAAEAAESRIGAGIHFRSDVLAGLALGRSVSAAVTTKSGEVRGGTADGQ